MDEQEVELGHGTVLEIHNWYNILIGDALQERHLEQQWVVDLANVLLQELYAEMSFLTALLDD